MLPMNDPEAPCSSLFCNAVVPWVISTLTLVAPELVINM